MIKFATHLFIQLCNSPIMTVFQHEMKKNIEGGQVIDPLKQWCK